MTLDPQPRRNLLHALQSQILLTPPSQPMYVLCTQDLSESHLQTATVQSAGPEVPIFRLINPAVPIGEGLVRPAHFVPGVDVRVGAVEADDAVANSALR